VTELLEERRAEPREGLRQMEAERLDAYMLSLHTKWTATNDPRYMALLLDVQQRRARLLGLDAPTVVDTNVTIEQREDAELGDLIEQARRKAQEARKASQSAQTEQGVPGT
jgi:membrane protein involved in colicin uptake